MASELREKTITGMIWNAMERFGSSFFLFVSNLVLARLLSPDDFGAIAMLMVFISLSETIVDAGFSSALIQKRDADQRDYSTIFVWNICFAVILYILLYLSAPLIANFYNIIILKDILRVQGLVIPLNSLILVHIAYLKKQLKFKKLARINLLAIIIGSVVGIISAFYGAGVWSLVLKLLLTAVIQVLCYFGIKCWNPTLTFDFFRLRSMFRFGGFIFLSRTTNVLYHNVLTLVIGKFFNASTLGYFNQARKLEDIPRNSLSAIVTSVTFPVFSQINNDIPRLRNVTKKCMRNMSFIAIPILFVAIVIAKPLFILLLTAKWNQAIPYFQILCLGGIAQTPLELNAELLNALGKSKITFYIRLFQQFIGICMFILGINFGMLGLLIAFVFAQYLSFIVSSVFSGIYVGYGLWMQIKDLSPFIFASILSAGFAFIPIKTTMMLNDVWLLLIQIFIFVVFYLGISVFFKFEGISTFLEAIKIKKIK